MEYFRFFNNCLYSVLYVLKICAILSLFLHKEVIMKKSLSGTYQNEKEMEGRLTGNTKDENKSSTRKKFGLISSLHNSTIKSGCASSKIGIFNLVGDEPITNKKAEFELVDNYSKGIPITPSDVLKLSTYTKSKNNFITVQNGFCEKLGLLLLKKNS